MYFFFGFSFVNFSINIPPMINAAIKIALLVLKINFLELIELPVNVNLGLVLSVQNLKQV